MFDWGQDGVVKTVPVSLMCSAAILTSSSFVFLPEHLTPFSCSHFFNRGTFTFDICVHTHINIHIGNVSYSSDG